MIRHLTGVERFLGIAPIGDPTKLTNGGSRKGPILRLRPISRSSSRAMGSVFEIAEKSLFEMRGCRILQKPMRTP